jgi:hypothetical protein
VRRRLRRVGLVVAALYAAYVAAAYAAMCQPPERFGAIMSHLPTAAIMIIPFRPMWDSARRGTLNVGDRAPDFTLPILHEDRTVTLAEEYRQRPVVLVFGSHT